MVNLRKISGLLLLLSVISACVPVVIGGAAAGGYYLGKDGRKVKTLTGDAAITTEINARYVKDDLVKARDIKVNTRNGIVSLTGKVPSLKAYDRAIALAYEVKGVKKVLSYGLRIKS